MQVRHVCDTMIEDHLEEIVLKFHRSVPDVKRAVCSDVVRACGADMYNDPPLEAEAASTTDNKAEPAKEAASGTESGDPAKHVDL